MGAGSHRGTILIILYEAPGWGWNGGPLMYNSSFFVFVVCEGGNVGIVPPIHTKPPLLKFSLQ